MRAFRMRAVVPTDWDGDVLVLVSFVLVLAAAVTLVVGLLQSGLTLIYLSIACSVLAGVVLAVAVLRGRPEPKAAPIGRPYTPPASAPPVPAREPEPAYSAAPTTSYTPPPPPPTPVPAARADTDDAATKAAGTALLGRLRGRRGEAAEPTPEPEPEMVPASGPATTEMPAVSAEADDGFPIADYDRLRATDLLRRLGALDRNQLEAVRDREIAGKNRFTILSRVDVLLASKAEPAWEVDDDEWEADEAEAGTTVIEVGPAADDFAAAGMGDDEFGAEEVGDDEFAAGEVEDDEADEVDDFATVDMADEEVDELVSPVDEFPIAGYESLTVGQILPRLSDLDAEELAQVREREQQGRARGTILDRIERLAAKSGAAGIGMPPASPTRRGPARKAPAAAKAPTVRKTRATKAIPVPPATTTTPTRAAVKKATAKRAAAATAAPSPRRKAAAPIAPESTAAPTKEAVKKRAASPRRKAAAPVVPAETAAPTQEAVKKARAKKATKRL